MVFTVNSVDGGLLAMLVATSTHSHNNGNKYKSSNDDKEVEIEEISVISEKVGCTAYVESVFVPKLP